MLGGFLEGFDHQPGGFTAGILLLAGNQVAVPDGEGLEGSAGPKVGSQLAGAIFDAPGHDLRSFITPLLFSEGMVRAQR